jgi:hypothetical protein
VHPDEIGAALAHSGRVLFQNDIWAIVSARTAP